MSKTKFFLVFFAILSLSISGCIFNADKYQKGDGIIGSAKYYHEDANNEVPLGCINFLIVGTFTDAYGRIMIEIPVAISSINKLISTSDAEVSSAWEYLYWNTSKGNGKTVTALYNGISGVEDLTATPEATPEAIANWETDSPRAYKAVTDALEAAMIDIASLNSTGKKISVTSLNLDNIYGASYLLPNKEWLSEIHYGTDSLPPIVSSIKKKVAGSKISAGPGWWSSTPMDHPIWLIVLLSDDLPDPFYGIVDGKTGELLESGWEADSG